MQDDGKLTQGVMVFIYASTMQCRVKGWARYKNNKKRHCSVTDLILFGITHPMHMHPRAPHPIWHLFLLCSTRCQMDQTLVSHPTQHIRFASIYMVHLFIVRTYICISRCHIFFSICWKPSHNSIMHLYQSCVTSFIKKKTRMTRNCPLCPFTAHRPNFKENTQSNPMDHDDITSSSFHNIDNYRRMAACMICIWDNKRSSDNGLFDNERFDIESSHVSLPLYQSLGSFMLIYDTRHTSLMRRWWGRNDGLWFPGRHKGSVCVYRFPPFTVS